MGRSRAFYEGLGFRRVEGVDEQGWAVVVHETVRLGLYEARHMGSNPMTLNFRGGDVLAIARELESHGYAFDSPAKPGPAGGASATLKDPDGYALFFDTAPNETRQD